MRLYRLSRGYRSATCKVSLGKLITKTKVKRTRLKDALKVLEARGYIHRLPDDFDNPDPDSRGMNFEVLLEGVDPGRQTAPAAERPRSADGPNKDKALKKDSKGERLSPQEIEAKTSEVVARLHAGEGIDEIAAQLASTMHRVDWAAVRSMAEASVKR